MAHSEDEIYYKFHTSAEICHSEINCLETYVWSTWKSFNFPIVTPLTSIPEFKIVCILVHIVEQKTRVSFLWGHKKQAKLVFFEQLPRGTHSAEKANI